MKTGYSRGFTLIELLVVVAIVMVLAALLFPVFGSIMRRSQYTTCKHNTEQWLKAMQMYMNDWNDVFPWCLATKAAYSWANLDAANNPHDRNTPIFYELMWKYTSKNESIKWCPAMVLAYCNGDYKLAEQWYGWSYWFQCRWSWQGFDRVNPMANLCGIHISEVKYPTRSPAIGDANRCHEASLKDSGGRRAYLYPIGYVDGHVRDVIMTDADENKDWYFGRDGSPPR